MTRRSSGFWCGARIGESPAFQPTSSPLVLCTSPQRAAHCIYTPIFFTRTNSIRNAYRGRIISPDESDAAQIRTPRVTSFLRDVALRDLAVHASHAACVDGRGDVYQWGDGFFAQESASASGDRKPVLTLRGKVRVPIPVPLHVAEPSYA